MPLADALVEDISSLCRVVSKLDSEKASLTLKLKSVRVHFAPGKIAITLELLGLFLRILDQNDRHSLLVLCIS